MLEEPLTTKLSQLVTVRDVVGIERYIENPFGVWLGRPMHNRRSLARAFVAKAVYDLATVVMVPMAVPAGSRAYVAEETGPFTR